MDLSSLGFVLPLASLPGEYYFECEVRLNNNMEEVCFSGSMDYINNFLNNLGNRADQENMTLTITSPRLKDSSTGKDIENKYTRIISHDRIIK